MRFALPSRLVLAAVLFAAVPAASGADAPASRKLFYSGEARVFNLYTGQTATQAILLEKILDPQAGLITELACYQEKGKPPQLSAVYMLVSGSSVTVSDVLAPDKPGKLTGTGQLSGPAWNWNFLELSMNLNGVSIKDVNFAVKDKLIARKQIFLANGRPIQLWEAELTSLAPEDYKSKYKAMGCK